MSHPGIITTFAGDRNQGLQVGYNTGSIHVAAPERPETPPLPSCFIPFRRDPDFVDRAALLDQIREQCSAPASRVALVGLGGVGKSQLAIEYCFRVAEQSPETWVFWAHASNTARLEQSYREIADQVKIRGRKDPHVNVFKLVHDWLRNEKNGPWLFVLDNADDATILSPPPSQKLQADGSGGNNGSSGALRQHLSRYLPPSRHGSVLVTSRTRRAALQVVEDSYIIPIEPMHDAAAYALLYKKLGDKAGSNNGIAELARTLENMPLALVQAAAYIRERAPRCSVRRYLEEFHRSDNRKIRLLKQEAGHLRRDEEAKNSIIITWEISFQHIFRIRQSAADLLSLMSLFDRQGIPETLLRDRGAMGNRHGNFDALNERIDENENVDDISIDSVLDDCVDAGFEDDILMLRNYSFVHLTTDSSTFEMHALVQLATRKWLRGQDQLERWKQQYVKNLCRGFPVGRYENWSTCEPLFPHAKSALIQRPESEESLKEWASLLDHAAEYALGRENGRDAEKMLRQSIQVWDKLLGSDHPDTLSSIDSLSVAYMSQGRWKEAEEIGVQVTEKRKSVLGEEHSDTLTSMSNLALAYKNQGWWKKAEELGAQVMEIRKKVLGEEHPDTLVSIANLATTYQSQGQWKEAEELGVQAMELRKRTLGLEHPDTLITAANLAVIYQLQGRWKKAEELGLQLKEIFRRVLGEAHPTTLVNISNLASTYWNQGRRKEAEELEMQVKQIFKRVLGEEHPRMLTSMANLATTYQSQGRWKEAEELGVHVMETSLKVLGKEHPTTITCMINLASTVWNQGRQQEAEELETQAIELFKKVVGEEHPDTLTSMDNLAVTYCDQGRLNDAERLGLQALETRKRVLGEEHPDTLTSMNNLASTYRSQGQLNNAEELGLQVLETRKRVLGEEHPDTLTSMNDLASTYWNQMRSKEAEELELQVLETRKRVLGEEHPDTLTSMDNLAVTYSAQGRLNDAEGLGLQVLEKKKRVLGGEHPSTLTSMNNLASTYWYQGSLKQAEELELLVMETRKRVLGEEHPDTQTSMSNLAHTWKSQSRNEEANSLMEKCFELRKKALGPHHPDTQSSLEALDRWQKEDLEIRL